MTTPSQLTIGCYINHSHESLFDLRQVRSRSWDSRELFDLEFGVEAAVRREQVSESCFHHVGGRNISVKQVVGCARHGRDTRCVHVFEECCHHSYFGCVWNQIEVRTPGHDTCILTSLPHTPTLHSSHGWLRQGGDMSSIVRQFRLENVSLWVEG